MSKMNKTGPKEDRLKLEGDWSDAMKKALKKEKPKSKSWEQENREKPKN